MSDEGEAGVLGSSERPLCEVYDLAVVDLDGTVYVGADAIDGAAPVLAGLPIRGMRVAFVTNNASRTPDQVAEQLSGMGVTVRPDDVVTSAQAAARLLADSLPAGAPVLVVGGTGLRQALDAVGLRPVADMSGSPSAVAQGWTPELDWGLLAEGAYALASGLPWIATNTDLTLPTDRGVAPGNGSFVALLGAVVGRQPDVVAGKPGVALLRQTVTRFSARSPLVVGDRLDTDIRGAVASGMDSLLVLTGVSTVHDLLRAGPESRPTFVAADLSGLLEAHPPVIVDAGSGRVRDSQVALVHESPGAPAVLDVVHASGEPGVPLPQDGLDLLRAAAGAAWAAQDGGSPAQPSPRLLELLVGGRAAGSAEERP